MKGPVFQTSKHPVFSEMSQASWDGKMQLPDAKSLLIGKDPDAGKD